MWQDRWNVWYWLKTTGARSNTSSTDRTRTVSQQPLLCQSMQRTVLYLCRSVQALQRVPANTHVALALVGAPLQTVDTSWFAWSGGWGVLHWNSVVAEVPWCWMALGMVADVALALCLWQEWTSALCSLVQCQQSAPAGLLEAAGHQGWGCPPLGGRGVAWYAGKGSGVSNNRMLVSQRNRPFVIASSATKNSPNKSSASATLESLLPIPSTCRVYCTGVFKLESCPQPRHQEIWNPVQFSQILPTSDQ